MFYCLHNYNLPWSSQGSLASQAFFIFIWLLSLSELSSWQSFAYVKSCLWKCHFEGSSSPPSAFWLLTRITSRLLGRIIYSYNTHTQWHFLHSSMQKWLWIFSVEDSVPSLLLYLVLTLKIELDLSDQVCFVNSSRLNVKKMHLERSFKLHREIKNTY